MTFCSEWNHAREAQLRRSPEGLKVPLKIKYATLNLSVGKRTECFLYLKGSTGQGSQRS